MQDFVKSLISDLRISQSNFALYAPGNFSVVLGFSSSNLARQLSL